MPQLRVTTAHERRRKKVLLKAGVAGDAARFAAGAALLWAIVAHLPEIIARFAVLAVLVLIRRLAALARPLDAAFGWTLLLATIAAAAGWYKTTAWVDWVIHCVTTGAVAAMAVLPLRRRCDAHSGSSQGGHLGTAPRRQSLEVVLRLLQPVQRTLQAG